MRAWGSSGADRRPEGDLGVEPQAGTSVSLRVTGGRLLMPTAARAHVRVAHAGTHRPSVGCDEWRNGYMVRAIATRASRSAARRRGPVREWGGLWQSECTRSGRLCSTRRGEVLCRLALVAFRSRVTWAICHVDGLDNGAIRPPAVGRRPSGAAMERVECSWSARSTSEQAIRRPGTL